MTDHSKMKLGKKAPVYHSKSLRLANYIKDLAPPPPSVDFSLKLKNLGMMLNDKLGDCTCAAIGHIIQTWTSITRPEQVILSDSDIEDLYEKACGYVPGDSSTDRGGDETNVLIYWRDSGIFPDHPLAGFVSVQPGNHEQVKQCLNLFGAVYIGVDLPVTAQTQDVWDVVSTTGEGAPGSWGGHAVPVVAYDADGLTVITWGALKKMTWAFWDAYCDEAHGPLSADWIENGASPTGQCWTNLKADLITLAA